MNRFALVVLVLVSTLMSAQGPNKNPNKSEPPILGPHWARGAKPAATTTSSNDLLYHGGPIIVTPTIQAIFWGSSWGTSPGDKINGMNAWYQGAAGTKYEATVDEYKDSSGHQVSSSLTNAAPIVDTSSSPQNPTTSQVLAEVCRKITSPQTNGYYPVYIDHKRKGNFCAYHSWGSCGNTEVQFAFFWKLDGDSGCDPRSTLAGQSEGLAALANVSGHELSETRSDPHGDAWYAASGEENGDECAWTFGGDFVVFNPPSGTNPNFVDWKIQGNWSNEANDGTSPNGLGYATPQNGFGVAGTGCVDGTNYPGPYTK
jgi:hypothetical protein